ncbi:hypothetical protein K523DRAFT_325668 [Schizophyllum commune Tattone D]|nr:hypothetical protein K523DRAFT_325668 [Schizophyllum commune Tattone D]
MTQTIALLRTLSLSACDGLCRCAAFVVLASHVPRRVKLKITDEHTTLIPHDTAEASKSYCHPHDPLGASFINALDAIYTPSGRERPRR